MNLKEYPHFICPLEEEILVILLDPEKDDFQLPKNSQWHFEMSMFDSSHAFALWDTFEQDLILIDKRIFKEDWFTADHLFVILAHEVGHIKLKTTNEVLANQLALSILTIYGLKEAKKILEEELIERSKIEI